MSFINKPSLSEGIEGRDFALALRIQTQASIPKLGEIHEIPEGSLGVVYREHLTMAEVQAIVSRFTANQALGSGGGLSQ
jgi:ubiquinone biosynthesis protein Coq4